MPGGEIRISSEALRIVLQTSPAYEAYVLSIGEQIRTAAIAIFELEQRHDNEFRTSEMTPPKYISEFRVSFHRPTLKLRVSNEDPGWYLVEYGSHPGGNLNARVRPYKPLSRAFTTVIVRGSL